MRVLIYGINYAPELTGIGKYSGELGAWMARNNHEVEVITALPYYPEWSVHKKYQRKFWYTEILHGVKVHRAPLYVPENVTTLKRLLHEFSFLAFSSIYWVRALFKKRYDIVICVAPAFHLGFWSIIYSKLRNTPFIYHIQDLQIDAAKDLGMIKNQSFLNMLFKAEKIIMQQCASVSTISEGMLNRIKAKGVNSEKCILFPNWVDINQIKPLPRSESLRKEFGLKDTDKVVLYSGNLGEKQGLEVIIDVARMLSEYPDLYFIIIGSGGIKKKLESLASSYNLDKVKFFPLQPYEKLSAMLATADIHLLLQKKSASDLVMPSKLTSILAAGGCCIVTAVPNSTLYDVVANNKIGILVEPESAEALKEGLEKALSRDLNIYRSNARRYAEEYLSQDAVLKRFEQDVIQISKKTNLEPANLE